MRHRKWTVALTVMSLALGVALLMAVERVRKEAREGFTNTLSGTDLIVGARTGSVSLLLSSVFHIGNASQNITWESYQKIAKNPQVAWTIPISLGDSHKGYRVLGTNQDYFQHYRYGQKESLKLVEGVPFSGVYDAVLGSEVAKELGYALGDKVVLSHGTGEVSFVDHDDHPFEVVGVLRATGTPVDRVVHVSLEGIDAIHAGWNGEGEHVHHAGCNHGTHDRLAELEAKMFADEDEGVTSASATEVTAFFVGMHSRADAVMLQRSINVYDGEALSAVLPGVALMELWSVVGVIEKTLMLVSGLVLAVALVSMLSSLIASLNERRREMAILRSVGASPRHLLMLVLAEVVVVISISILAGLGLFYTVLIFGRQALQSKLGLHVALSGLTAVECLMLATVMIVGVIVACFPAWVCYRRSLADGLSIK